MPKFNTIKTTVKTIINTSANEDKTFSITKEVQALDGIMEYLSCFTPPAIPIIIIPTIQRIPTCR
ncbi:MAG: hypothetical protein ACRC3H_00660 [Lachnospiraceae bacterium]